MLHGHGNQSAENGGLLVGGKVQAVQPRIGVISRFPRPNTM